MGALRRLSFFFLCLAAAATTLPQTSAHGRFEMRLPEATDRLSSRTLKLCLKQFETSIRVDGRCGIGSAETPLQNASADLQIPFSFEWKENYSLIVQISESDRVIDQLVKSDTLRPGEEWRDAATENGTVRFQYRLLCEPNFYGKDCLRKCFPTKTTFCAEDGTRKCLEGWTGRFCREPICEEGCVHGRCQQPGKCLCASGYKGPRCDQCIPMQGCVHGSCSAPFGCDCEPGWGGTNCNTSTSLCTRMQPCLNGGQCLPFGEHSFVCQCPPGFTGPTCATPLSPCAGEANPCANGATCQPVGVFDFLCRCPEGWTGRFCDRLDSRQCQNGGVRTEEGSCLCPSGFEGTSCELKTAPKKKICGQGFEGKGCESKKPEKCDAKLVCRNGGWCEGDVVKCNCPRCFSGLDCSLREPGCEESQQLRLISATLAIVVVLVLVLLVLIVFLFRRRTVEQPGLETVAVAKKEQKIYSTSSDYASRYGADPCERAPTQRLREAAAKALGDDPHYAEIDAPSV